MKKLLFLLLFPFAHLQSFAGDFWHRIDRFLYNYYYDMSGIDTSFIVRPGYRWSLFFDGNTYGAGLDISQKRGDEYFTADYDAEFANTLSIGFSYLGWGFSLSANPYDLKQEKSDYVFALSSYGNRMGVDFTYRSGDSFSGVSKYGDEESHYNEGTVDMSFCNINYYYSLNQKKFSYPAALSQSFIQRKSAGGLLIGASYSSSHLSVPADTVVGLPHINFMSYHVGLGVGYGYNFIHKKWLFHLSTLPTFTVYSSKHLRLDNLNDKFKYSFPEVIITARGVILYQFSRCYVGAILDFNYSNYGKSDKYWQIANTRWNSCGIFGIRL